MINNPAPWFKTRDMKHYTHFFIYPDRDFRMNLSEHFYTSGNLSLSILLWHAYCIILQHSTFLRIREKYMKKAFIMTSVLYLAMLAGCGAFEEITEFVPGTSNVTVSYCTIDNNQDYTGSLYVNLDINAKHAARMRISEDPEFEKDSWLDYASFYNYRFSNESNGPKTIYFQFADEYGDSTSTWEDSIIYSTITQKGVVNSSEWWFGDVEMLGDVEFADGTTLYIAPGTRIRGYEYIDYQNLGLMENASELIIRGALMAQGTEEKPIVYQSFEMEDPAGFGGPRIYGTAPVNIMSHWVITNCDQLRIYSGCIENCELFNLSGNGINAVTSGDRYITVKENRIHDLPHEYAYGIRCRNKMIIQRNVIYNCSGTSGGGILGAPGFAEGTKILNNTIDNCVKHGIHFFCGTGVDIENNLITNCGLGISADWTAYNMNFNNLYGNERDYYPKTAGLQDISCTPWYCNPSAHDYSLLPGSPCIDHGDPSMDVPQGGGTAIDIGAYEYIPE